jgi:hypothetical protein
MPRRGMGLQPGTKAHFVAQHIDKSAKEIAEIAKAQGIALTISNIHSARYTLKTAYGLTKPVSSKDVIYKPGKTPKKIVKAGRKQADDHTGESQAKTDVLRRIIFEVGFDRARGIFDEFIQLHQNLRK